MLNEDQYILEKLYTNVINYKPMPKDWKKGFEYPIKIGAGGHETPFVKDGHWYLRVWNSKTKEHLIYSYSEDVYYPDNHFTD